MTQVHDDAQTRRAIRDESLSDGRGIMHLLTRLYGETSTLIRDEFELAKLEMIQKGQRLRSGAIMLGAGSFVAYAGLLVLLASACCGLAVALWQVMPLYHAMWVSPLIVGAVVAAIGGVLLAVGAKNLKKGKPIPEQTIDSVRENKEWLRSEIKSSTSTKAA